MGIENRGNENHRPRWLVGLLIATALLVIMALGAYFLYGGEPFQRPFVAIAVVMAGSVRWSGSASAASLAKQGSEQRLVLAYRVVIVRTSAADDAECSPGRPPL